MLGFILLGFLMHSDMSGYDMKRFMGQSTSYFYNASFGSIYPAMKNLEDAECVTVLETVEDGKYRKLYSITEKGRKRFLEWLEQPIELDRSGHNHLMRIFFYGWLDPAKSKALISDYISRMEAERAALEDLERKLGGHGGFYELSTLDYGKGYYTFTIDWCRNFIEKALYFNRED